MPVERLKRWLDPGHLVSAIIRGAACSPPLLRCRVAPIPNRVTQDPGAAVTPIPNTATAFPESGHACRLVILGQVAARLWVLDVACNRCDRHGQMHTSRLLAMHGSNLPMPDLRWILAADCPRMIAGRIHDVCGVHFPGLIGLDLA
jgi:hypothetical protein